MSFKDNIISQFKKPSGWLGRLAGWIMANRKSNQLRNIWTLDILDVCSDHHVLEIGFGPGYALEHVCQRIDSGSVTGIDHSVTMLEQATMRNQQAIEDGKLELVCASIDELPLLGKKFDRIYSSNVAMFWSDRVKAFADIKACLNPGGKVVSTHLPRAKNADDASAMAFAEGLIEDMKKAGFQNVSIERGPRQPVLTVSAVGVV